MRYAQLVTLLILIGQSLFSEPEHIPKEVWDEVKPHLIPDEHPAKAILDRIFTESRVTSNTQSIRSAGFKYITKQGKHIKTVRHPLLKDYLVKILTDNDITFLPAWKHWIKRIEGAERVREGIIKYQYDEIMTVPKKWIYMLPKYPMPRKEVEGIAKHFVMVVEDVNILGSRENQIAYKKRAKKKHLRALFHIISEYGLRDSCSIDKIPWTKNKRIAFINTECVDAWPVDYQELTKSLDPANRIYWQQLIKAEKLQSEGEAPR